MITLRRCAALVALTGLAACGGGGGGSSTTHALPAALVTAAPSRTADAGATLTLRFPAKVAKAKFASTTAATAKRGPQYINPNGGSLVITVLGQTMYDPANPGKAYFSLGTANPDGSSILTISLLSGNYNPGDLTVTEYDGSNGTGNVLAYGYNGPYTDGYGNAQSGAFSLAVAGSAAPVVTMVMNATNIALTTDPVNGSDGVVLNTSSSSPTNFGSCVSTPTTVYAFAADPSGTFVLEAGYTGGDPNRGQLFPGVPSVTRVSESTSPSGGGLTLQPTAFGGVFNFLLAQPGYYGVLSTTFYVLNPLWNLNNSYSNSTTAYATLGNNGC
jgi:hypothetical protein